MMGPRKKSNLNLTRKKFRKIQELKKAKKHVTVKTPSQKRKTFSTPMKSPLSSSKFPLKKKLKLGSARPLFKASTEENSDEENFKVITDDCLYNKERNAENNVEGESKVRANLNPLENIEQEDILHDSYHNFADRESISKSKYESDMIRLVPEVMEILSKERGLDSVMFSFFRQVKEGKFPLNNIAFLLWVEVVKWFDTSTTSGMRYSDETKLFWKLGWRLFGGRFLYYMGGYKNSGDIVMNESTHGSHESSKSEINFAVPHQKVLRHHIPYLAVGERIPGIYKDIMRIVSTSLEKRSACLTFDGKKIKQGLTDTSGDVNLLGFGEGEDISHKHVRLKKELEKRRGLCEELANLDMKEQTVQNLPVSYRETAKEYLIMDLQKTSQSIFTARELQKRKEYCRMKLIERGGDTDWRKGKYVYAISAITAFIYDIEEFLKDATVLSDRISRHISALQASLFVTGQSINLTESDIYIAINQDKENEEGESRLIKQQSDEWFELRAKAKVTGSTIYGAIGCDGMNNLKKHFDKVVCQIPEKEHSDVVKAAMEHGRSNEINGVATLVGKVLPVFCPNLLFCEEGCVTLPASNHDVFMVVSPDGSVRKNNSLNSTVKAVEIKCPVKAVHTEFPSRYLLQCVSEIESLNVSSLLFASWTENETVVFEVHRDLELFEKAKGIATSIYGVNKPKKPTKLTDEQKSLKEEIISKSKSIEIIGRFQSLKNGQEQTNYDTETITVGQLVKLLENINDTSKGFFELTRQRATEAVVFLVADLDRSWEKDSARSCPVAWFPKGYSLCTDVMRSIAEEVHSQCHDIGIHLPCQSFDGQWHKLVVRSLNDKPLTTLQLQKDVWRKAESMKKTAIIQELRKLNEEVAYEFINTRKSNSDFSARVLCLTNGGLSLPKFRSIGKRTETRQQLNETDTLSEPTLADVIPDVVRLSSDISDSILALEPIDGKDELEALNVNVNDVKWARELEILQNDEERNQISENDDENSSKRNNGEDVEETENRSLTINLNDASIILSMLKTSAKCNKLNKWESATADEFLLTFSSQDRLKTLLDVELKVVVRYLNQTKKMKRKMKESSTKHSKIRELCQLLGLEHQEPASQRKTRVKKVKTLADLAADVISKKIAKQDLNVIYAEYIWPEIHNKWKDDSAVGHNPTVNGTDWEWFYIPEFSTVRKQLEVRCIDSTHLLTRTRRISCKGGLEGQSNEAWVKVARSRKTLLTPVMVEDVTDPMSVSMASTHFSSHVEKTMRDIGYKYAADLCHDIREWWEAEDKPAIPASKRIEMRIRLRKRLLSHLNFSQFPPPTMYVMGWPVQLWEALVASIDAKTLLYGLCHNGTYNVRAFSSMIGETFFAELTLNDKRGQGTVTCQEFGQFIGNAVEQIQARLDPDRPFSYRTCRSTVYNLVDETANVDSGHHETCRICRDGPEKLPIDIRPRNHHFDKPERGRIKGTKKEATVEMHRNAIQKGSLGVRWEKARRNESKLLPTKRMGIAEDL